VGDLYEDLGAITAQVSVSRLLAAEDARLPCRQTKATRTMRLTCDGLVNMRLSATVWVTLPPTLMAEAVRGLLGRMSSSTLDFTSSTDCGDSKMIKDILAAGTQDRPCVWCSTGTDSRTHVRQECPTWRTAFRHVHIATSTVLGSAGFSLWFAPNLRVPLVPDDCNSRDTWERLTDIRRHAKSDWRALRGHPGSSLSVERGQCLSSVWLWPSMPSAANSAPVACLPSQFAAKSYAVHCTLDQGTSKPR
jgi:hypothetical protein